ncbi:MAG: PaaI family thioesterase [Bacteroidetes bacterium]|nr:PaaI family thioesterase [Bacteroidota bacterium]
MELKQISLDLINRMNKNTLMEQLGIECIDLGKDYVVSRMPVDNRTHQPMGLLHGGASAALIESIGSMGSTLLIDLEKQQPVGLEINCNHVGGIKSGFVIATGKVIHAGTRTHLWQVDVREEGTDRLICTGRLTVMIIDKKN